MDLPRGLGGTGDEAERAGSGLAVERVGERADDSSVELFVAEPDYVHAWPNPDHASVERAALLTEPAIKRLIEPAEVAAAVAYLCSEAASFVNGSSLILDGGWSAR